MSRPSALAYLWRHHRVALIGMGLALAVAAVFAVRLTLFTIYWADPAHRDQRIEGWMTPGYIARSWEVEPGVIRAALALEQGHRPTLAQVAEAEGVPLPELIARLEAAIAAARAR
ncbi:hypothetical protein [Roseicyclus persicicus]|uniref:Uncharacterized protein n=1 Tax=Roseicyclus persicicus TaxID=2650661 RepID=A0A7X6JW18_9RHOB|nr:hypothetical protein [Roseibacterium persicicum]NKX43932.1 hypothetical protein [Roseibacterium persicicum]